MWRPLRWVHRLLRAARFLKETEGKGYDDRLIRAFHGTCPHCGKELIWKKHSGKIFADFMKACPQNHFAVEYHGHGVVTYHDKEGDPIDYLFQRSFRVVRNEDNVTTKKVIKPSEESVLGLEAVADHELEDE